MGWFSHVWAGHAYFQHHKKMNYFFKLPNLLKRASSLMLFEGAVVSIIKQHGGDYGLQKLFGTFGAVIFGPLSGVLIDFGHDYSGVIILYFCLRAATALCILKLDLNFKVIYFSWKLLSRWKIYYYSIEIKYFWDDNNILHTNFYN